MLAILRARRTTRAAHEASPQRERYLAELAPWREAFGETVEAFAGEPVPFGVLRRAQIIRVLHPSGALPAIVAKRWWGVPFVVHLGYDPARLCELRGARARARVWRAWLRWLARKADGLLVSARPERWRTARAAVFHAPNGADPERFFPARFRRRAAPAAPTLLYVGRESWEKNLGMLDRAWSSAAPPLGRFNRLTRVPWEHLPGYYAYADVFALPSFYEGSPKALWEAMACGAPALVTSAIEDRPPADTCAFIDPHDEAAWAAQIRQVLAGSPAAEERAQRALAWVRRERDARVLNRREVAFALAVAQGVDDPAAAAGGPSRLAVAQP